MFIPHNPTRRPPFFQVGDNLTSLPAVKDYREIPGNQGVYFLRRIEGDEAEFVLVTFWESVEAIKEFAGPDYEKAVYYPEDPDYLLFMEPTVKHYELFTYQPEN